MLLKVVEIAVIGKLLAGLAMVYMDYKWLTNFAVTKVL
jgi:hypothetical protein